MINNEEKRKLPKIIVGAFIENKKGEIFFIQSPKWNKKLAIPGGHIEYNESAEEAVKREVKEETGLDIAELEYVSLSQLFESTDSCDHFVALDYKAKLLDENQVPQLDAQEALEYVWLSPEEAVKRDDIVESVREVVQNFFIKKKKSFFSKEKICQDCQDRKKQEEELKAGWQRALADYKNLQKEIEQRKKEWIIMSEVQILEEFIPVYDNFKKAINFANVATDKADDNANDGLHVQIKTWENWKKGIEYIMKQFGEILKIHNVEEVKTVGELFNPEMHEAMREEQIEGKKDHEIIAELDGGYILDGKVIKAAKVVVNIINKID